MRTLRIALLLMFAQLLSANSLLVNLPANTWYSAPNAKMRPVCSNSPIVTARDCWAVLGAWCSAAYDPVHHKMICFGGGHMDYWGNEVYTFDVNTMRWNRITEPSPGPFSMDPLADGNPVSRHTYDGLCYVTHANRFFAFGGSQAQSGTGTTAVTWTFDVDSAKWHNMEPTNGQKHSGSASGIHLTMAYHEKTRKVYVQAKYSQTMAYDFDSNTWTRISGGTGAPGGDQTSTIDTKRDLMFTYGRASWKVFDIMNRVDVTPQWLGAHPDSIPGLFDSMENTVRAKGFAYDEKADRIVCWAGGPVMHILDPETKSWSQVTANGPAPVKAVGAGGIYGRFRYIPEYNVFILVNSVDSNVTFYKYSAGAGADREYGPSQAGRISLSAQPNPFNPEVVLKIRGTGWEGGPDAVIRVYNARGALVEQRITSPGALRSGISWNAAGKPSGVYLLRLNLGERVVSKRLMLAK